MNAANAATAILLIAGLTACGSPTPPATAPTQPHARISHDAAAPAIPTARRASSPSRPKVNAAAAAAPPGDVNSADADSVAEAVVITTNQSDTETDYSSLDPLQRARQWLTPALLAGSSAVPHRADAGWTALAAHHGYTSVDHIELANEYGQPPNTAASRYIQISYQVHEHGRDGWDNNTGPQLARLRLIRKDNTWKVKAFD